MPVISRLNINKQVVAEIVRAFKSETEYARHIERLKTMKQVLPDLF